VRLVRDHDTLTHRGFGFVEFAGGAGGTEAAMRAVELDGLVQQGALGGTVLGVRYARSELRDDQKQRFKTTSATEGRSYTDRW
jgi:hypothetical protein